MSAKYFSTSQKWDSSKDPFIFAHISDTHVSNVIIENNECFKRTLAAVELFKPNFSLITGDLVDNFDSRDFPRYGDQELENWLLYSELSEDYTIPTVEVGGNHDMFGVRSFASPHNYISKYSISMRDKEFEDEMSFKLQTYCFPINYNNGENEVINIIAMNPFDFPTAHPSMLTYANMDQKLLDELENAIEKYPRSIVMSHYPVAKIHSDRSSKGRTFEDIVGSNDIRMYLSGHTHPLNLDVQHHGVGGIEFIGPSARPEYQLFGIVTIDNDQVVWTQIDQNNPAEFIVTHPTPKEQISIHTNFENKESEIRVIRINEKEEANIHYSIYKSQHKILEGSLEFVRKLENGFCLFSAPLVVEEFGEYRLVLSGDFEMERTFIVDISAEVGGEELPEDQGAMNTLLYLFLLIWLVLAIIVTPFPCKISCEIFENIEDWIEGIYNEEYSIESNEDREKSQKGYASYYLFSIFFGFFFVRTRVQRAPIAIKLCALFVVYSAFFVPSLIFETEGVIGIAWVYGIFIEGHSYFADFAVYNEIFYLVFVCFPMLLLISSFGVKNWSRWLIGDSFFALITLIGIPFLCVRSTMQTTGRFLIGFSPKFVLIPIFVVLMFVIWRLYEWHIKKKEDEKQLNSIDSPLTPSITNICA